MKEESQNDMRYEVPSMCHGYFPLKRLLRE